MLISIETDVGISYKSPKFILIKSKVKIKFVLDGGDHQQVVKNYLLRAVAPWEV